MLYLYFFFFNDTATTEIYTLSLHDALPIYAKPVERQTNPNFERHFGRGWALRRLIHRPGRCLPWWSLRRWPVTLDRKSTRLNSSHSQISYAVFCLKKKKKKQ